MSDPLNLGLKNTCDYSPGGIDDGRLPNVFASSEATVCRDTVLPVKQIPISVPPKGDKF